MIENANMFSLKFSVPKVLKMCTVSGIILCMPQQMRDNVTMVGNVVSHWLGSFTKWSLGLIHGTWEIWLWNFIWNCPQMNVRKPIHYQSTLVQRMAWRNVATHHCMNQCWLTSIILPWCLTVSPEINKLIHCTLMMDFSSVIFVY